MSSFTAPLTITIVDKKRWRLERELAYYLESDPDFVIRVPKGMITDGASVPGPFRIFLPQWGSYSRSVVIHDYVCLLIQLEKPLEKIPDLHAAASLLWECTGVEGSKYITRVFLYAGTKAWAYASPLLRKLGYKPNYRASLE